MVGIKQSMLEIKQSTLEVKVPMLEIKQSMIEIKQYMIEIKQLCLKSITWWPKSKHAKSNDLVFELKDHGFGQSARHLEKSHSLLVTSLCEKMKIKKPESVLKLC